MEIGATVPQELPVLDSEEIRVLGALMEKSRTTPEYYPMTLNGLTAACNQKSSRNPVVQYDEQTVALILDRLKRKNLAATVTGGSSRVVKYRHTIVMHYQFTPDVLAVLCLLFLRGPLTPGEINSNAARLYEFEDIAEVHALLERLSEGTPAYVKQLERQPGQKEARYRHLFADETLAEAYTTDTASRSSSAQNPDLEQRVAAVEAELEALKQQVVQLLKEWNG